MTNVPADRRPTNADPRAYSIGIRYELIEGDWAYVGSVAELPDLHVYERSSCEAYSAILMTIEDLQEHNRDCGIAFPEPFQYRPAVTRGEKHEV
jgi:predicted RNase H-like HicB family nuclease